MTIPKSWNDISISQYVDLIKLSDIEDKEEKELEYLSVLLSSSPEEIKKTPSIEMNEIISTLKFANKQPKSHFRRVIEIEGIKFGFVTDLELLTLGEWVDLDMYTSDWELSRAKLATVLWRPIVSENPSGYIIEDYDSQKSKQWEVIFNNKMSIQDLWGGSVFFFSHRDRIIEMFEGVFNPGLEEDEALRETEEDRIKRLENESKD